MKKKQSKKLHNMTEAWSILINSQCFKSSPHINIKLTVKKMELNLTAVVPFQWPFK